MSVPPSSSQPLRHVTDAERRARLATRHAIAPAHRVESGPGSVSTATRAITALHATEAATVYLSLAARIEGVSVADIDEAIYVDRAIVKQLAMRRTLFAFTRELLPAALGSASARVEGQQRRALIKLIEAEGIAADGSAWLRAAEAAVLARLADGEALTAAQLREQLPELAGRLSQWAAGAQSTPIAPRVLTLLGLQGFIVRGRNAGHWRLNKPTWAAMPHWLGERSTPLAEAEGYAQLVTSWLRTFGPGTETDLVWWLGATKAACRRALAEVGAVAVSLDSGEIAYLLPDDLDEVPDPGPWAALLPALDPTTMGWKQRDFYLDPSAAAQIFDRNGNGGTTAWWCGRIVGCWVQDTAGVVQVHLHEDVGAEAQAALAAEAARLTAWLDSLVVTTIYASPAMKAALLA